MKISINIYTKIVLISVAFFLVSLNFALPYRFYPGDEVSYLNQVEDSYEINILNLKTLQKKRVPNRVLEKLENIKGQISKYYIYRDNLVDLIGQVDFDKYKRVILNNTRRPFPILTLLKKHQPVFFMSLHVSKVIWGSFSDDYNSMLVFNAALCSSITMVFLALIVYLITSNKYLCYSSLVLYATSTWVLSYSFFYSYVVLAGMFGTASTYFLILAYLKKRNDSLVAAGVLSTLLVFSSISSIPFIVIQVIVLCVLFYGQPGMHKKVLIFIVTMYITMSPLFGTFIYEFELHLLQNLTTNKYLVQNKIPLDDIQLLSILWVYNKVFLVCLLVLLGMYLTTFLPFKKILTSFSSLNGHSNLPGKGSESNTSPAKKILTFLSPLNDYSSLFRKCPEGETYPSKRVLFALVIMLLLYSVLMEKTGYFTVTRGYFVIYPILIIVFIALLDYIGVLMRDLFLAKSSWRIPRSTVSFFIFLIIFFTTCYSVYDDIALRRVGKDAPQFLQTLINEGYDIYFVSEDPHIDSIKVWLISKTHKEFDFETVSKNTLQDIIDKKETMAKIAVIIKGPYGLINDLQPILKKGKRFSLYYNATFFAFLLENDIQADLIFTGVISKRNHRKGFNKIKVFLYE